MTKKMRKGCIGFLLILSCLILSGCYHSDISDYQDQKPTLDLKQYLSGHIKGWGMIHNWRGKVTERFTFDAHGSWKGNIGKLDEDMVYSSGRKDDRIWTLKKVSNNHYIGTTPEVVGQADIRIAGNAMNWTYTMDVKVDDSTYRLNFDDWMFLINDDSLINVNRFKKFGFTVGGLTLFMHKVKR